MLKLALPSKGRLMENTLLWFEKHGIQITRTEMTRTYSAIATGIDAVEPVFLSASEIPRALAAEQVDFGVTGMDMMQENVSDWHVRIKKIYPLGFGHADLVIAVPAFWYDVESVHDLDFVAADFRARHGFRLRIATKYHTLARRFLDMAGVADYQLIDSHGATEGSIKNNLAEAVIDITSSGKTLRDNGLKILSDGLILKSQATLFCAQSALRSAPAEHVEFLRRITP